MEILPHAALPFLTFLIAVISFFIEKSEINSIKDFFKTPIRIGFLILLIISTLTTIFSSFIDSKEKASQINSLRSILINFQQQTNQNFKSITEQLNSFGWVKGDTVKLQDIEQSIKANQYRTILSDLKLEKYKRGTLGDTTDLNIITIEYFPKNVDSSKVFEALKELNYKVQLGRTQVKEVETNAIWFSSDVKTEDVKLVALTLIRANVKIKVIRPFRADRGRKKFIQIGADRNFEDKTSIAVDEIVQTLKFKR